MSLKEVTKNLYDDSLNFGKALVKFPAGILVGAVGSFALPSYLIRIGYFGRNSFTVGQLIGSTVFPAAIFLGTLTQEALREQHGEPFYPERLLPLAVFAATNVASYFIERHRPNSYFYRHRI